MGVCHSEGSVGGDYEVMADWEKMGGGGCRDSSAALGMTVVWDEDWFLPAQGQEGRRGKLGEFRHRDPSAPIRSAQYDIWV